MDQKKLNEIVSTIQELGDGEYINSEMAHVAADNLLLDALELAGLHEVVNAYKNLE